MKYAYIHLDVVNRITIACMVVKDHNTMEPLYPILMWAGKNFIAIGVETVLAFLTL
jgi:hypothetical protein